MSKQLMRKAAFKGLAGVIGLGLLVLAIAACGGAAEPEQATPAPEPTSAPAASGAQPAATEAPPPAAMMAPAFELPNAAGENISLASYAGDRNVVLVFYRGFW